jgi:hypothetical protein
MKMLCQAQIVKHKIKYGHKNTYLFFSADRIRGKINADRAVADGATAA